MKAAGCEGEEILGLVWKIHIFPSSIKGDAVGNPTLFVSSHFPLESWALLESNLNSCSCLIYIHTAKDGGPVQGCQSHFSTVTAGASHSAQGMSCAVFRAVTYTAEDMGFSLYFYCSNPLCPVTWFLIRKQRKTLFPCSEDVEQILWDALMQLWNIAMFIHKMYAYSVTYTRDVRISLSVLGVFLKSQDSGIPWLKIWSLKIHINILKRKAPAIFPAFLVEERKLRTMPECDCSSNWKSNKKEFQIFFFPLNPSPCNSVFWWLLCSMGFVLFQSFSPKHKLSCRTAGKANQHVFTRHCGSLNYWMNLAHSPRSSPATLLDIFKISKDLPLRYQGFPLCWLLLDFRCHSVNPLSYLNSWNARIIFHLIWHWTMFAISPQN